MTCATCRYWKPFGGDFTLGGSCVRYPPRLFWQGPVDGYTNGDWKQAHPATGADDWCGEWKTPYCTSNGGETTRKAINLLSALDAKDAEIADLRERLNRMY